MNSSDCENEYFSYPSLFGEAEVFTLENDNEETVRVLYVGGGFQSASFIGERRFEPVFSYIAAFDCIFDHHPMNRVLMIGGGAFSYPKLLLSAHENTSIDVVEIDPHIVSIARKHFYLDELEARYGQAGSKRLRCIVDDGCQYLACAQSSHYDAIINDSFDGTNPTGSLMSEEALANAKRCLQTNGLYVVNVSIDEEDDADYLAAQQAANALATAFNHVYQLVCIDEEYAGADNYLLIASDAPQHIHNVQQLF